jgi:hypothetical protein
MGLPTRAMRLLILDPRGSTNMAERREGPGQPRSGGRASTPGSSPAVERERVILLECRLDQLRSQLEAARADADHARAKLAEAAAREADHARRYSLVQTEIAEARAELASVHQRLERAEALRAELEGHLIDAGPRADARELLQLRRDLLSERQRARGTDRTLNRLRERNEQLLASRETLFARFAEWQELVREDGFEAADLSEFLSELRREVMDLEHRNAAGEHREAALRERFAQAGLDPDAEPVEPVERSAALDPPPALEPSPAPSPAPALDPVPVDGPAPVLDPAPAIAEPAAERDRLVVALAEGNILALRTELAQRIGRTDRAELVAALRPGTQSADATVRAAAYEALGRVLEDDAPELESVLRAGLADPDGRVRRRVVLAAVTARGVALRPLLEPLGADPDPQVKRVVREALRHARPAEAPVALAGTDSAP